MFGGLGMGELLIIFMVALLLFGAKRLPEIGKSLGKGIREFKGSVREIEREINAPPSSRPGSPQSQVEATVEEEETDEDEPGEPRRLTTSS